MKAHESTMNKIRPEVPITIYFFFLILLEGDWSLSNARLPQPPYSMYCIYNKDLMKGFARLLDEAILDFKQKYTHM